MATKKPATTKSRKPAKKAAAPKLATKAAKTKAATKAVSAKAAKAKVAKPKAAKPNGRKATATAKAKLKVKPSRQQAAAKLPELEDETTSVYVTTHTDVATRTDVAGHTDFAPHAEPPPPPPPRPAGPAVVHWEVQARDPAGQRQFFADLFGWEVDANNPQEYGMVQSAGVGIGGGIGATLDIPRTTFYVQVEDIASTLAKAEAMGAQTVLPRTDIGMIVMGQFRDREGNLIGLVEPWEQPELL